MEQFSPEALNDASSVWDEDQDLKTQDQYF